MKKRKPATQHNPHLKDKKGYKKSLISNVASSTAIEIGALPDAIEIDLKKYDLKSRSLLFNDSTPLFQ